MAGGGGPIPKGTFKVVRYITLDDKKLAKIAEVLGIDKSEADDVFSGEVHIVPKKIQDSWHKPKKKS